MSESESFGIVLLEAWLAGRPVVAARKCAAFAEIVVHGENGFLAGSAGEIVEAVETYLTDEATATRHAAAGRVLARSCGWPQIAAQFEGVLLESTPTHCGKRSGGVPTIENVSMHFAQRRPVERIR
jgi:glycosyltransferase involved in cell wall biosynthesis